MLIRPVGRLRCRERTGQRAKWRRYRDRRVRTERAGPIELANHGGLGFDASPVAAWSVDAKDEPLSIRRRHLERRVLAARDEREVRGGQAVRRERRFAIRRSEATWLRSFGLRACSCCYTE